MLVFSEFCLEILLNSWLYIFNERLYFAVWEYLCEVGFLEYEWSSILANLVFVVVVVDVGDLFLILLLILLFKVASLDRLLLEPGSFGEVISDFFLEWWISLFDVLSSKSSKLYSLKWNGWF